MSIPKKIEKHLTTTAPVQVLIKRSKQTFIPGFSGFSLFEVWPRFVQQLRNTSLLERASGISFNVVMAIPPTLLFLFTLIPYLPLSTRFIQELFTLVRTIIPGQQNNAAIIAFLDDFLNRPRGELLSFGLLLALFFSSNAMMGILRSFDKNYEGFGDPTGLQKRSMALQLTMLSFVLFFVGVSLLIAQGAVLQWLGVESYALR
ncbi:MAG: YhjD/YihY/BrkB family envelope integrity protein, partial [Chitinophagaceae bacterium]